jgi:hypothetical protein
MKKLYKIDIFGFNNIQPRKNHHEDVYKKEIKRIVKQYKIQPTKKQAIWLREIVKQ